MKIIFPAFLFLLTFIIRSYKVEKGNFVIWDEAHFGKFSEKYLSRKFYFDVHPPFGKMLTALSGYIFDQPLNFTFESGSKYPKDFDYCGMRRFHALISSLTPAFSYLILKELKYSKKKTYLLSLIFVFENGFTSIGRLILLDSHLLAFTSGTIYFLVRVYLNNFNDYDLFFLGLFLGLILSIKWIGCFTTAFIGCFIAFNLYKVLKSKSCLKKFSIMFIKDSVYLILVPIAVYTLLFYIHFKIVNQSSSDESHLSSFFQASLKGNSHIKNRKYVAYGTRVTVKAYNQGGGYLHSHNHEYPTIDENQVTTYSHKDNNNNWVFQRVSDQEKDILFMTDKDEVVIYHLETEKYINVLNREAYLSKGLLVTASSKSLSQNNVFIVEVVEDIRQIEKQVKSITTKFLLRHANTGKYLKRTEQIYPEWGFSQGEVICSDDIDDGCYWSIEENISEKIPVEVNPLYEEIYKNMFIRNLIEHNKAMYTTNKSFVQDKDLEPDRIVSRPYEWPILFRGLRMCSWDDSRIKFYMFGNPFLWYASTICTLISPIIFFVKYVKYVRRLRKFKYRHIEAFEVFLGFGGWLFHYIPFFFVGRVLYFHHYYPALWFSLFSVCYVFKHINSRMLCSFVWLVIYFYFLFSPLTYGFIDKTKVSHIKYISSWDFID